MCACQAQPQRPARAGSTQPRSSRTGFVAAWTTRRSSTALSSPTCFALTPSESSPKRDWFYEAFCPQGLVWGSDTCEGSIHVFSMSQQKGARNMFA